MEEQQDDTPQLIPKKAPAPNPRLAEETGLKDVGIVNPYSVMLNLTDVAYGVKGHNKFYQIQVLVSQGRYYLWTKWGRVGASSPFSSLIGCTSKQEATIEFSKKFRQKTKNNFGEPFKQQPGKYSLVEVRDEEAQIRQFLKAENIRRRKVENGKQFPLQCNPLVGELMGLIWDFDKMRRTMRELNLDPDQCPLGRLTSTQIQKGYKILREIQKVITTHNRESAVIQLTNEFYTQIPQSFGMKRPPLINHMLRLKEKVALLDTLHDLELAHSLSIRSLKKLDTIHPYDVYYEQLACDIRPVSEDFVGVLQAWVENTRAPTHNFGLEVISAFSVERKGEANRYWPFKKLDNKRMLWHGSRITNYVGILSQGLRIAPREAPTTGYMLGKGVYFSDLSSKAANYCMATPDNPEGILLLCEVALGNAFPVQRAKAFKKPPLYYHSVQGVGKVQPVECQEVDPEVMIMTGGMQDNPDAFNSELRYNEFVVYDVGQVKIRYLIKVRFVF